MGIGEAKGGWVVYLCPVKEGTFKGKNDKVGYQHVINNLP